MYQRTYSVLGTPLSFIKFSANPILVFSKKRKEKKRTISTPYLVPKAVSIHLTVVVTERGVSKWSPSYVHVIKLPHVGADYLISVNIDNLDMK